jgi:hypothetical protein
MRVEIPQLTEFGRFGGDILARKSSMTPVSATPGARPLLLLGTGLFGFAGSLFRSNFLTGSLFHPLRDTFLPHLTLYKVEGFSAVVPAVADAPKGCPAKSPALFQCLPACCCWRQFDWHGRLARPKLGFKA